MERLMMMINMYYSLWIVPQQDEVHATTREMG